MQYNERIVFAPFEIIEKCYPFIVGMNYFHQFELAITGLASPDNKAMLLPEPDEVKNPLIIPVKYLIMKNQQVYLSEKIIF